jgi:hypothetical protein
VVAQGRIETSQDGQIIVKDVSPADINGELKTDTFSVKLASGSSPKVWTLIQSRAPPPPTSDRLDDLKEFLTDYDLSFLVDDSGSMQSLWDDVGGALQDIVKIVFNNDGAGIDLGFVNSDRGTKGLGRGQKGTGGIKSSNDVMETFKKVKPKGTSDIGPRLEAIIKPFLEDIDDARKKVDSEDEYAFENEKSLSVIVITDGKESGGATKKLKDVLTSTEKRFKAARPIRKYLHIIFLKVGSQEKTTFDIPKDSDIVHIVKHEPQLTSKKILEVLLGRFVQASEPGSTTGPSVPSSAPILTLTMQQTLLKHQIVILVDDSPSMLNASNDLSKIIAAVVDKAVKDCGLGGIDLRFIDNDAANIDGLKNGEDGKNHLVTVQADASSEESIKAGLSSVLSAFTTKWKKHGDKSNIKPLNVIFFTDGKRDDGVLNANINAMIQMTADKLNFLQAPPSSAGIQFVVMGGGISFQPIKKSYVNGMIMVDTTEYDAQFTERKLVKILLGAVDPAVSNWQV